MCSSKIIVALFAVGLVSAAPVTSVTDADILNYALTLEHLENTFYSEGLSTFTAEQFADAGFDGTFYQNLQEVSNDEATHVDFLTGALTDAGATPVEPCTYEFGYTDVPSFLATASILEGVGVSAYLGAAASILEKAYLTAAGSILTVEARHTAYLRASLDRSPFPQPFDAPLTLNEVYSLASAFIVSCPPENPPLPVKAFPSLTLDPATSMPVKVNHTVTLLADDTVKAAIGDGRAYAAFIAVTGPTFVPVTSVDGGFSVPIPEGFAGQTYAVLTDCTKSVTDDTTVAGPAIIEI